MYFSTDKALLTLPSDPELIFKPQPTGSHKQGE
jgi:hypothetical protein